MALSSDKNVKQENSSVLMKNEISPNLKPERDNHNTESNSNELGHLAFRKTKYCLYLNNSPIKRAHYGSKDKIPDRVINIDGHYKFVKLNIVNPVYVQTEDELIRADNSLIPSCIESISDKSNGIIYLAFIAPPTKLRSEGAIFFTSIDNKLLKQNIKSLENESNQEVEETQNINEKSSDIPNHVKNGRESQCKNQTYAMYDFLNPDDHVKNQIFFNFRNKPISISLRLNNGVLESLIAFSKGIILKITHKQNLSKDTLINYRIGNILDSEITKVKWIDKTNKFMVSFCNGKIFVFDSDYEINKFEMNDPNKLYVKNTITKSNPIGFWNISSHPILDFKFSPCGNYLAVAGRDGKLSIISTKEKKIIVNFRSYYGGFTTLDWSHDGKFIITGGEDDIVSIWGVAEKILIARGYGHKSWVSKVIFDKDGCKNGNYRFFSVGEDCKCSIWSFSIDHPSILLLENKNEDLSLEDKDKNIKKTKEDDFNQDDSKDVEIVSNMESFTIFPVKKFIVSSSPNSDISFLTSKIVIISSWGGKITSYIQVE